MIKARIYPNKPNFVDVNNKREKQSNKALFGLTVPLLSS